MGYESRDEVPVKGNHVIGRTAYLRSTLALVLMACSLSGCERTTHVKLEGGAPPVFDLSGSGAVAIFTVFGPDFMTKAEKPRDENFAVWKIEASGGYLHGTWIRDLGSITYGVVPFGYRQIKPQDGTPPPLKEGQKYLYVIETTAAPGTSGYFEIRNSRAVSTTGSAPCFLLENGKWIPVRCYDVGP